MPFTYGKVSSESSTDEEQHPGTGRITFWSRFCNATSKLRWPTTFFLLLIIFAAQVQILHRQPPSHPIGSEINGLVPTCKSQSHFPPHTH